MSDRIAAYENFVSEHLKTYYGEAKLVGDAVFTQADLVATAFQKQLSYILYASTHKSPSEGAYVEVTQKLATDLSHAINAICRHRDGCRGTPFFDCLSTVSESIAALSWVVVRPAPAPFLKEMIDAGTFYQNRVIKSSANCVSCVRAWIRLLTELQSYVKQYHTTGLCWNASGLDVAADAQIEDTEECRQLIDRCRGLSLGAAADTTNGSAMARDHLFKQLNREGGVTTGLRHVTADMKQSATTQSTTSSSTRTQSRATQPPGGGTQQQQPVCRLNGKRWQLEHQRSRQDLCLDQTDMSHTVYVYACTDCCLRVLGKVNSITLDSCRQMSLVFDAVVASVELVNSRSVKIQCMNKIPTLSVDKCDGLEMYLPESSLDVVIITAKSSAINIMLLKADGDYVELPVPEQFKTTIKDGALVTIPKENV